MLCHHKGNPRKYRKNHPSRRNAIRRATQVRKPLSQTLRKSPLPTLQWAAVGFDDSVAHFSEKLTYSMTQSSFDYFERVFDIPHGMR